MTLTLTHDEVQQYFDTQGDLTYYKDMVTKLEKSLHELQQKYNELEESWQIMHNHLNICEPTEEELDAMEAEAKAHATGFSRPKGLTHELAMTAWTPDEYSTIKYLFNKKGIYSNEKFSVIAATLFEGRSEAAVYTKLRECGFRKKNGCLIYPIKLDTTKFPA